MKIINHPSNMNRRQFVRTATAGLLALGLGGSGLPGRSWAATPANLPALPFAPDALEPYISARTIDFHYHKHHAGYVRKLEAGIQGTQWADLPLVELIRRSAGQDRMAGIFNNAAQVWNHTFYWQSMKPGGGGRPSGDLAVKINTDFGSFEKFITEFSRAASAQFGSGWAWLVIQDGRLGVMKTGNADTPVAHGIRPLLTLDVWEHAYYLDYQNRRNDYIQAYLDHLVHWEFAEMNLKM